MLNRDGVRKYSYNNTRQILANVEFQESVGCIVPQSMGVSVTGNGKTRKIVKAGTPLCINLDNINEAVEAPNDVIYPYASYGDDQGTIEYSTGTISILAVDAASGKSTVIVRTDAHPEFIGKKFVVEVTPATLDTAAYYRLYEMDGTALDMYVKISNSTTNASIANAVLLHDVDVTDEVMANGTACIFGFINTNRVDDDVKTLISAVKAGAGFSPLLTFMAV